MYTDGITEAKNPDGEEFGYDRLKQIVQNNIRKSARDIQDEIINGLLDFTQADEIEDDFTTMILKFN
jgi:serine phosphatase RsbU (regulator of sigma subunit)